MGTPKDFKNVLLSEPHMILGKNGITDEFITHTTQLLRKKKIIKIKALKSIANKNNINQIAEKVVNLTNSYLIDLRGRTFIISKYPMNKNK
jgi:RNA-binding protein YhbY